MSVQVDENLFQSIEKEIQGNSSTTPMANHSAIFRAISAMFQGGLRLDEEVVVATALYAWDNVVVKYDVPYVPETIEKILEDRLRPFVEGSVRMLVQQFSGDPEKTVAMAAQSPAQKAEPEQG